MARDIVARPADDLFLLYHRPSGETHVVAAEMLAILEALDGEPLDAAGVAAWLAREHEIETEDGAAVAEIVASRLTELTALGLIDPA